MFKDLIEIKKFILSLEEKFTVDQWNINDVDVWPLIRIKLYIYFLSNLNEKRLDDKKNSKISKKQLNKIKITNKIVHRLSQIKSVISYLFLFVKIKKREIIFFGSHLYRVQYKGFSFHKFYDPMIHEYNLQDKVWTLEYPKMNANIFNKKSTIDLHKMLVGYKLINKYKTSSQNHIEKLSRYDDFIKLLEERKIDTEKLRLSKKKLYEWVFKINRVRPFFNKVYKKINPQKIIFTGYYGLDDIYGAVIEGNTLGIRTIDFQHGPQANYHMVFCNWSKLPEQGYNSMVTEYWNWDIASKKSIDEWALDHGLIKAKIVGQPFFPYWLKENKVFNKVKRKIIYSLQLYPLTLEDMFSKNVIEIIKSLNVIWILRLHPRSHFSKDTLTSFCKEKEIIDLIEIEDSFLIPLSKLLFNSILHVTNYSGCLIEASMLNTPTVIINKIGFQLFNQYIDDINVKYIDKDSRGFKKTFFNFFNNIEYSEKKNMNKVYNPLA